MPVRWSRLPTRSMKSPAAEVRREKVDLIIVGNQNTGKTSLINKFIGGEKSFSHLYNPTLGISLEKKVLSLGREEVTVCIWDTAGQEKFFSLTKNYFRKADGVLVIFDLTDKSSFEKVSSFWIDEVRERAAEGSSQILIGNKLDKAHERAIAHEDAHKFAQQHHIEYFETSAKTGEGVSEAIEHLVKQCLAKIRAEAGEEEGFALDAFKKAPSEGKCFGSAKDWVGRLFHKLKGGSE